VRPFADGAFHLAVKAKVHILPLVIEGSRDCIPKNSWKFGKPSDIHLKVLPPVDTSSLTTDNVPALRDKVRMAIMREIAEWRSVPIENVDGMAPLRT
jgi:1-acyl-sn-glycerol-3-phosphate acyltransferase